MLAIPVLLGGAATLLNQVLRGHEGYDRETISVVPLDLHAACDRWLGRGLSAAISLVCCCSASGFTTSVHGERAGRLRRVPGDLPVARRARTR